MSEEFNEQQFWVEQWKQKLDTYLQAPPRAGIFVRSAVAPDIKSTLELGAGSCRDTFYLRETGLRCTASDFNAGTQEYLRQRFGSTGIDFRVDDARSLPYADNEFDVVYHNGLVVCFDNDADVHAIIREQFRVARRYAVMFIHNGENQRLRQTFAGLAKTDSLYNIRFFTREQIGAALRGAGVQWQSLTFQKFGGPPDWFYARDVKGVPNPFQQLAPRFVNSLYPLQPWSKAERIAVIAEL